jgi:hypothetical protein
MMENISLFDKLPQPVFRIRRVGYVICAGGGSLEESGGV